MLRRLFLKLLGIAPIAPRYFVLPDEPTQCLGSFETVVWDADGGCTEEGTTLYLVEWDHSLKFIQTLLCGPEKSRWHKVSWALFDSSPKWHSTVWGLPSGRKLLRRYRRPTLVIVEWRTYTHDRPL